MREGDVVVVYGKQDDRVREATTGDVYGTIVDIKGKDVTVLLTNGDMWRGAAHEVVKV